MHQKQKKLRNINYFVLWVLPGLQSIRKNNTRKFCLFVYLQCYNNKSKFSFSQTVQSSCNTSYLRTNHFCTKCQYRFLAAIFLFTLKKIPWKNYVRFWKWNIKCTPQSAQNLFSRKSNLRFCIIFNMISFANAQGSVKIRSAWSKVLLLINYLMVT